MGVSVRIRTAYGNHYRSREYRGIIGGNGIQCTERESASRGGGESPPLKDLFNIPPLYFLISLQNSPDHCNKLKAREKRVDDGG